jgi:hypothetical protein
MGRQCRAESCVADQERRVTLPPQEVRQAALGVGLDALTEILGAAQPVLLDHLALGRRLGGFDKAARSAGTVAAHQHPIQAAMLAVIVIEAGFMQRGAVIDDQQVTLLILVRIAKLRLRDLIG